MLFRSLSFLTKLERLDLGCNELDDLVSFDFVLLQRKCFLFLIVYMYKHTRSLK